jgi:hypothetical protein
MECMTVRRVLVYLGVALLVSAVSPTLVAGQATTETQKGAPPAPNTATPEYAPAPGSPPKPPIIEPTPGKPALAPGSSATDERGQIGKPARRTVLGLRWGPAVLLGVIAVGLLILAIAGIRRRPGPG